MSALNWLEEAFTSMIVKLDSVAFPKRATLRFEGTGVDVDDDADAGETVVRITAGEGGGGVPTSRTITAGNGLTGGGTLAADRTLSANFASSAAAVGSSSAGSANTVSRGDHVHAHGDQLGGTLHAAASGSAAGFESVAHYTLVQNLVTQSKTSNFTVSAARYQHFIVDVSGGDVTATLPTSSRETGDIVVCDVINGSTNKLIFSASDTSLPAEFATGLSTTLNVVSTVVGNAGRAALRWNGTFWAVVDHPRMRNAIAAYAGYGTNAGYWVSPVHRWEPKDGTQQTLRGSLEDRVRTTNNTPTVVATRTLSTASRGYSVKAIVWGVNAADGNTEIIELRASAVFKKNSTGNLAQEGATQDEGKVPSASSLPWTIAIAIGATNVVEVKATGESSKTIDWFAHMEVRELVRGA